MPSGPDLLASYFLPQMGELGQCVDPPGHCFPNASVVPVFFLPGPLGGSSAKRIGAFSDGAAGTQVVLPLPVVLLLLSAVLGVVVVALVLRHAA